MPKKRSVIEHDDTRFYMNLSRLHQRTLGVRIARDVEQVQHRFDNTQFRIPLRAENRFANDLAFLLSHQRGAEGVTAVAIQAPLSSNEIHVTVAANGGVDKAARSTVSQLRCAFQGIASGCKCRRHYHTVIVERPLTMKV